MIGSGPPGYLGNQYVNPNLLSQASDCERPAALSAAERIEMERIKAQYAKQARNTELIEISRTLECLRQRLVEIDLRDHAEHIDQIITGLIMRWESDRKDAQR